MKAVLNILCIIINFETKNVTCHILNFIIVYFIIKILSLWSSAMLRSKWFVRIPAHTMLNESNENPELHYAIWKIFI